MRRTRAAWLAVAFAVSALSCNAAIAQQYPTKPIRIIVPNTPGGGADTIARLVADTLATRLGQQAIVDNRGGAGGRIGAELAMRSPPDGHTLLLGTGSLMITAPALYHDLPYDPRRDFTPISLAATTSYLLCSHPSIPARTVGELLRSAKASRTSLNYGSTGPGTFSHLGGELLKSLGGIGGTHIAFKGSAQSTISLVQGEIDIMFNNFIAAMPLVRASRLRALGVTTLKRSALVPDIPTLDETGLKGFEMQQIYSVWGPAGMPQDVVRRLNQELVRGLAQSDAGQKLAADGTEIATSSPAELGKYVATQVAVWTKVVRSAGIKGE